MCNYISFCKSILKNNWVYRHLFSELKKTVLYSPKSKELDYTSEVKLTKFLIKYIIPFSSPRWFFVCLFWFFPCLLCFLFLIHAYWRKLLSSNLALEQHAFSEKYWYVVSWRFHPVECSNINHIHVRKTGAKKVLSWTWS